MAVELAPRTGLIGVPSGNGLALPPDLTFEEWRSALYTADLLVSAGPWYLVDLMAYGEARFGEAHSHALPTHDDDPTGDQQARFKQAAWMAQKYPRNQRVPGLSYTHHRAAAELDPDARRSLLEHAAAHKLSTRELIALVKDRQATEGRVLAASSETGCAADLVWHPSVDDLDPDVLGDLRYAEATSKDRSFLAGALWALAYLESEDSFRPGRYQPSDATAVFGPAGEGE